MTSVRKQEAMLVLALALVAWGCSNGGRSPTAPANFETTGTEEVSAPMKGGPGGGTKGKDPNQYELMIGGMVPGTFEGFFRSGQDAIAKPINCAVTPGAAGLDDCPADFPDSGEIISFLDSRFPGAGLATCFRVILALNDIIIVQPSSPDPNSFDMVIEFTARTLNNGVTNNNAVYHYVGEISRAAGETLDFPPPNLGDVFDMVTDPDDTTRLVPGRKRNGCPAGPVQAIQGAVATVTNLGQ